MIRSLSRASRRRISLIARVPHSICIPSYTRSIFSFGEQTVKGERLALGPSHHCRAPQAQAGDDAQSKSHPLSFSVEYVGRSPIRSRSASWSTDPCEGSPSKLRGNGERPRSAGGVQEKWVLYQGAHFGHFPVQSAVHHPPTGRETVNTLRKGAFRSAGTTPAMDWYRSDAAKIGWLVHRAFFSVTFLYQGT